MKPLTADQEREAALRITKARVSLLMEQPFYGQLAIELEPTPTYDLPFPTMATDAVHLFYDPRFVLESEHHDLVFITAHEIGHVLLDHIPRGVGKEAQPWDEAIDYAVNDTLVDSGMTCPSQGLLDPAYHGWFAEKIYEDRLKKKGKSGGAGGKGGQKVIDHHMPAAAKSQAEVEALQDKWKRKVISAAAEAKKRGHLPGCMERLVEQLTRDEQGWRQRLHRFATQFSPVEPSWSRLNRRWLSQGIYLPGKDGRKLEVMVVVTDDSGSIGNEILSVFGGETAAARAAAQPQRTILISCDAAVNWTAELDQLDELKLESHGGGGTDFRPPFGWLEERGITPDCLIYLTDGYGAFPKNPAPFPVLWCMTTDKIAPWGETVRIDINQ